MITTYILFVVGFAALIKGADLLVDGASSLARKFGISTLVIGLTIVAFGTSMPELVVNLFASLNDTSEIAIGNVLGSNIANILLILGISATIFPLAVKKSTVWKEIPFCFLAIIVLALMVSDIYLDKEAVSILSKIDGFVLMAFFAIFIYYTFGISKTVSVSEQQEKPKQYSLRKSIIMIMAGMIGLIIGGKWIIDGAVIIATGLGVSQALIGLTIVAVGTSLPELATSAVAAYKKNVDIAVGNVVGSNIFNIFWILGISSIIKPLPFSSSLISDVLVTALATFLLFIVMFVGKRHILERWQGIGFIIFYIAYIGFLIIRE